VPATARVLQALVICIFFVILVGAAWLARHNLHLGRGDRKGALRLAGFVFVLMNLSWLLAAHHIPSMNEEFNNFIENLSISFFVSGLLWLVYMALEPYVRRRWPGRIIAWNRLIAGDWRDPLVGRDLLLGAFFGCLLVLVGYMQVLVPQWMGLTATMPAAVFLKGLSGFQYVSNLLVAQVLNSLVYSASVMLLLLLLTILTRRERVAVVLLGLLHTPFFFSSGHLAIDAATGLIISVVTLFVLLRFGMLALVFMQFFVLIFNFYPVTSDFSAWYAGTALFAVVLGLACILYGFKSSLAGQPLFQGSLLGD
jgi:serine/threonine-protein kinase